MIEKAIKSGDINVLRKTFKKISKMVASKGAPEGYGVAFCPMADNNSGAWWIQKKGQIANPYFGASMLRCGSFKEYKAKK
jgi:Cu(I)/Ag(I) efflux system membrane fusion protein